MSSPIAFYDSLAPLYHLVYQDWEHSLQSQSAALAAIIRQQWGELGDRSDRHRARQAFRPRRSSGPSRTHAGITWRRRFP